MRVELVSCDGQGGKEERGEDVSYFKVRREEGICRNEKKEEEQIR